MSVRIFAMTHKKFDVPPEQLYIPMHVGHANAEQEYGYLGDDTGDNISKQNCLVCTGCGRIIQGLIMWESAITADS